MTRPKAPTRRRDKDPLADWIRAQRRRLGWSASDLATRLTDMGVKTQEQTVRAWETGRLPRPRTVRYLEIAFRSPAPQDARVTVVQPDAIEARATAYPPTITISPTTAELEAFTDHELLSTIARLNDEVLSLRRANELLLERVIAMKASSDTANMLDKAIAAADEALSEASATLNEAKQRSANLVTSSYSTIVRRRPDGSIAEAKPNRPAVGKVDQPKAAAPTKQIRR